VEVGMRLYLYSRIIFLVRNVIVQRSAWNKEVTVAGLLDAASVSGSFAFVLLTTNHCHRSIILLL
jgi:glucan biosynthesis protein